MVQATSQHLEHRHHLDDIVSMNRLLTALFVLACCSAEAQLVITKSYTIEYGADLFGADLLDAELSGANLSDANLR